MAGLDISQYEASPPKNIPENKDSSLFSLLNRNIEFTPVVNDKFRESFYLELSILLSAGVDIKAALELLGKQQTKIKVKNLIGAIKESIISGKSLSQALMETHFFSEYETMSLQIGEETGKITVILGELNSYFNKKIKQRQQIVKALSYPVIVLATALGAVAFMIAFIIPMFSDIFKRFGGKLPYLTTVIINFSAFLRSYFWLFFLLVGVLFVCIRLFRKKEWFRRYSSSFLLKIPLAGEMLRQIHLARLSSSFSLLIASKVPLLKAMGLVRKMIPFYPIQTSLSEVEKDILSGKTLHESLARFSVYDARMITLIKVGEEVNELSRFFGKLATQYNEEVEYKSSVLSSAIEPFIIIILGGIVAVILIAMYLPLFELSSNFG